ncbi:MAG: hypothetical protein ACJ8CO_00325 [Microvirga sp.]|jgi:hypothetical protein
MTLTWTLTAQVAVLAAVLSVAGLLYARHLANKFDREFGPKDKPPAE